MEVPFRMLHSGHIAPIRPTGQHRRHHDVYTLYCQDEIEIHSHSAIQVNLSAVHASYPHDEDFTGRLLCLTPDSLIAEYGCHCITRIVYTDEVITVWIGNMTDDDVLIPRGKPICELTEY